MHVSIALLVLVACASCHTGYARSWNILSSNDENKVTKPPAPTKEPRPTHKPTAVPTHKPTVGPTHGPTKGPKKPTTGPTHKPTVGPTHGPTKEPKKPTTGPTHAPTATPTPPPGYGSYFGYNNTKYFFSCGKGEDWMSAWMGCRGFGYNVVKITDEYQNEALRAIASFGAGPSCNCGKAHVWIGLVYEAESDRYVWEGDQSEPTSYTNWASGQPGNHTAGVNCVYMDYNDGRWYEQRCDHKDLNFMCQGEH